MTVTRRALALGLLAPLAAASQVAPPQSTSRTRKRLDEIAASLYTWDMAAENIDSILASLRETAQVNSVYFMAMMHGEERPLTDLYFPRSLQLEGRRCPGWLIHAAEIQGVHSNEYDPFQSP